jgi:hypothetical protein
VRTRLVLGGMVVRVRERLSWVVNEGCWDGS